MRASVCTQKPGGLPQTVVERLSNLAPSVISFSTQLSALCLRDLSREGRKCSLGHWNALLSCKDLHDFVNSVSEERGCHDGQGQVLLFPLLQLSSDSA